MPEVNQIVFNHRELTEILIKQASIHDGKWMLIVNFSFTAANVGPGPTDVSPAGIVAITSVGIQRAQTDSPGGLVVDAAQVNPAST